MFGSWWTRLKKNFEIVPDLELGDIDFGGEAPPIATSFRQTGRLPRASRIEGVFSRFHSKKWTFHGPEFHQNFEDSERKWERRDRYADANIQCGHFFGCTTRATEAEAKAYRLNRAESHFFEAEMTLDGVLDLTYEENLDWMLGQIFHNPEKLGRSYFTKLIEFIHHGIRFFGSRALRQYETTWQMNPEDPLIYDVEQATFPEMRADLDLQNIVLFSGALVTQQVKRYRLDGAGWRDNPLYGMPFSDLDRVLKYPSDFQDARRKEYLIQRIQLGDGRGEPIVFREEDSV